jgi:hypothetical protein
MATSLGMAALSLLEARRTWRILVLSLVLGQLLLAPPAMVAAGLRLAYRQGLLASQPAARPNCLESHPRAGGVGNVGGAAACGGEGNDSDMLFRLMWVGPQAREHGDVQSASTEAFGSFSSAWSWR